MTERFAANDITLEVIISVLAADFDEDGNVDGADLLAWQTDFGTSMNATHTDGNDFLR